MKKNTSTPPRAFVIACGMILCLLLPVTAVLAGNDDTAEDNKAKPAKQAKRTESSTSKPAPPDSPYLAATTKTTDQGQAEIKVYTNADLPNLTQVGTAQPATVLPDAPVTALPEWDPLAELAESQREAREHNQLITVAQTRLAEAEKRVADLEQRKQSITNPFMARPQPLEEEGVDWGTMTAPKRLAWTSEALEAARKERVEAQQRLSKLGPPR
jgi:hypothetical protein